MRSIPFAMTKEFLRQIRWQLPLALLGGNLLPLAMLALMKYTVGVDLSDPDWDTFRISFQILTVPINIFIFAATVIVVQTQNSTPRMYTLPIATSVLINWRLVPAMALIVFQMLFSMAMLNWLFDLRWPYFVPTVFAAVSVVAIQSALWFPGKSPLQVVSVSLVGIILVVWFEWRCHWKSTTEAPSMWVNLTISDALALLAVALVSYPMAHAGMERNRHGESLGSTAFFLRFLDWIENLIEKMTGRVESFQTRQQAFFWIEWQLKGLSLPAAAALGMIVGFVKWLMSDMQPHELIKGMEVGGVILSGFGLLCGFALGSYGIKDPGSTNITIGPFLGSCPLSNVDLSWTTLRVAARSVMTAWLIWALPFASVLATVAVFCEPSQLAVFSRLPWWYVPSTLLGAWIAVVVPATIVLTGRAWLVVLIFWGTIAIAIISIVMTKQVHPVTWAYISSTALIATGIGTALGSVSVMIAATSRSLITVKVVAIMVGIWGVLDVIVICEVFREPNSQFSVAVFLTGVASLVVMPVAAAPLAVAWNRAR